MCPRPSLSPRLSAVYHSGLFRAPLLRRKRAAPSPSLPHAPAHVMRQGGPAKHFTRPLEKNTEDAGNGEREGGGMQNVVASFLLCSPLLQPLSPRWWSVSLLCVCVSSGP